MFSLFQGDAGNAYEVWPQPDLIVSDGAYGVGGFKGDPEDPSGLAGWYAPHVRAWSGRSKPSTSLWLWGTEIGWATLHPLLEAEGWEYVELLIWDKGMAHAAGNINGRTIRMLPVVTEVSALYRRRLRLQSDDGMMLPCREWLRREWMRSGLPLRLANDACGVKSAATRKYLTADRAWYRPPGSAVERMASYCERHGRRTDRPYFSLDGRTRVTAGAWDALRAEWNHKPGVTNVIRRPPLSGPERLKYDDGRTAHPDQKPLDIMSLQVRSTTNAGDVVWEPFGGLASASVAAVRLGRRACVAETDPGYARMADRRLREAERAHAGGNR